MSEDKIRLLANHHPVKLITLMAQSKLDDVDLSIAIEMAGSVLKTEMIVPHIDKLLHHPSPLVREGAIYGASYHLTPSIKKKLLYLSRHDESEGVREAATDILE